MISKEVADLLVGPVAELKRACFPCLRVLLRHDERRDDGLVDAQLIRLGSAMLEIHKGSDAGRNRDELKNVYDEYHLQQFSCGNKMDFAVQLMLNDIPPALIYDNFASELMIQLDIDNDNDNNPEFYVYRMQTIMMLVWTLLLQDHCVWEEMRVALLSCFDPRFYDKIPWWI